MTTTLGDAGFDLERARLELRNVTIMLEPLDGTERGLAALRLTYRAAELLELATAILTGDGRITTDDELDAFDIGLWIISRGEFVEEPTGRHVATLMRLLASE